MFDFSILKAVESYYADPLGDREQELALDEYLFAFAEATPTVDPSIAPGDFELLEAAGYGTVRQLLEPQPCSLMTQLSIPWTRIATYRLIARLELLKLASKARSIMNKHDWRSDATAKVSGQVAVSVANAVLRGDEGERIEVVVQMPDDLNFESLLPLSRGERIARRQAQAQETQANLLRQLELNESDFTRIWLSNQFIAPLNVRQIRRAAHDPAVVRISPVLPVRACVNEATPRVEVAQLAANRTGMDQIVAVIDSGINDRHADFRQGQVVHKSNYTNRPGCDDENGHGTHLAGIIGSRDTTYRGISPNATIWCYRALDHNGHGTQTDMVRAIQDIVQETSQLPAGKKIVVNCSFAVSPSAFLSHQDFLNFCKPFDDATSDAIVVVAAGNGGPEAASITAPGGGHRVITVGASMNRPAGQLDVVSPFTSRGPVVNSKKGTPRTKPDIVAPGGHRKVQGNVHDDVSVVSSRVVGGTMDRDTTVEGPWQRDADHYGFSGTSQAAALVSGLCALLLEEADQRRLTTDNARVRHALKKTARRLGWSQNEEGAGLVQADSASAFL